MPARTMQGTVVSDSCDKTVTVLIERQVKHSLYKKYIRRRKKFSAHDENNEHHVGDVVVIRECAPLSKHKRFKVISKVSVS